MNANLKFRYQAVDQTGSVVQGYELAASAEQAAHQLEQRGLDVTSIVAVSESESLDAEPSQNASEPIKASEPGKTSEPGKASEPGAAADVTLNPAAALHVGRDVGQVAAVGLPLESGLAALAAESPSSRIRRGLEQLVERLRAGDTIDDAMNRLGVEQGLVSMLRAGRLTYNTMELLELYQTQMGISRRLRLKIIISMFYPCSLFLMVSLVLFVLMYFIVPDFSRIYTEWGLELSFMSGLVLGASKFVVDYWHWGASLALAGSVSLVLLIRYSRVDYRTRSMFWRIPWIGTLMRWLAISRFSRLLSILVGRSIPLPQALRLAGDAAGDICMKHFAGRLADRAEQGQGFAGIDPRLRGFPASLLDLMKEGSGNTQFSESLAGTAEMFEMQAYSQANLLYRIAEPMLYILLAGLVGTVVIGLMQPLFELLNGLA